MGFLSGWGSKPSFPVQGNLAEIAARDLLQAISRSNRTGILSINGMAGPLTVAFLFGRPYYASSPAGTGDEVFLDLVQQHQGAFSWDARAKLPTEENISDDARRSFA